MLQIISKQTFLYGLLVFLLIGLPKDSYKPKKKIHTTNYNENLFRNNPYISKENRTFILKLIPLIQHTNQKVLTERDHVLMVYTFLSEGKKIKSRDKRWLKRLEIKYRGVKTKSLFDDDGKIIIESLDDLLSRVDMVPIRLALTQAAIESAWGKSRFCKEGNAYFGIHCYKPECGMKAKINQDGGFEVKSYNDAQESIDDYVLFLNSKRGMQRFRDERVHYFHEASIADILALSRSMRGYSAIGQTYQELIASILRKYIPENIANN